MAKNLCLAFSGGSPNSGTPTPRLAADPQVSVVVGLHSPGLTQVRVMITWSLRLLVDRRDQLGIAGTNAVNRLHRLLLELLAGGAKKFLFATQARARPQVLTPGLTLTSAAVGPTAGPT